MCVHDFGCGAVEEEALFDIRGETVVSTALLMVSMIPSVHWRCGLGHREAMSAMPR